MLYSHFFMMDSKLFFILENWKLYIKQTNNSPLLLPPGPGNHCSAFSFYESVVFFLNGNIHYFKLFRLAYDIQYCHLQLCYTQSVWYLRHYANITTISLASTCLHKVIPILLTIFLMLYCIPVACFCNWCLHLFNPIHLFWTCSAPLPPATTIWSL